MQKKTVFTLTSIGCLALLTSQTSLRPTVDHDTWWHLRIGQVILRDSGVPSVDPISRMGIEESRRWQAYSWLHECLMFQVFQFMDLDGIAWFRTFLAAISASVIMVYTYWRVRDPFWLIVCLTGISLTLIPMAMERPWHWSIAFTVIVLASVQRTRDGKAFWHSALLVPLFTVWANLHIQFVLGWGVLCLACIDPGQANRGRMVLLLLACMLATLINPFHYHLIKVIIDYAGDATPRYLFQELSRPDPLAYWSLTVIMLVISALIRLLNNRSKSVFDWGLLFAGIFFASRMNRDLWFGALCAVAAIGSIERRQMAANPIRRYVAIVIACLVFAVYICMRLLNQNGNWGERITYQTCEKVFPVRAVNFLKRTRYEGPLFNDITWGGYLAWALPEYPVTIDGRTNLYGAERLIQSSRTWSLPDAWQSDSELQKCRLVLGQRNRPLVKVLRQRTSEWNVVYEDELTVILIHTAR